MARTKFDEIAKADIAAKVDKAAKSPKEGSKKWLERMSTIEGVAKSSAEESNDDIQLFATRSSRSFAQKADATRAQDQASVTQPNPSSICILSLSGDLPKDGPANLPMAKQIVAPIRKPPVEQSAVQSTLNKAADRALNSFASMYEMKRKALANIMSFEDTL
jgi:hypothetical protein